jgi:hypothetical protein
LCFFYGKAERIMPRIRLDDISNLKDPLNNDSFEFVIPFMPGSFTNSALDMRLKCQSVSIPGFSTQPIEVNLFGHMAKFRGDIVSSRQITVTFIEDSNFDSYRTLREWFKVMVNPPSGDGKLKKEYARRAILNIFDATGKIAVAFIYTNVFIESVETGEMQGASSEPLIVNVTFSYDFVDYEVFSLNQLGSEALRLVRGLRAPIDKMVDKLKENTKNIVMSKVEQAKNFPFLKRK